MPEPHSPTPPDKQPSKDDPMREAPVPAVSTPNPQPDHLPVPVEHDWTIMENEKIQPIALEGATPW
jgi:hypothetical protein